VCPVWHGRVDEGVLAAIGASGVIPRILGSEGGSCGPPRYTAAMGVRAEIAVHEPSNCPVTALSSAREQPVTDVTWTRGGDTVTEEFRVTGETDDAEAAAVAGADPVMDVGEERVYQFSREADATCACEVVESLGHPLADVRVERGALVLTLHLEAVDDLRDVVRDLDATADTVEVRYLVHTGVDADDGGDRTLVDRGALTDRQREVLETAHDMGYFEYPRESNATEVAAALDISPSTLAEHLAAAQGKLLDNLLTG